jgi:lipoprotein NlpD
MNVWRLLSIFSVASLAACASHAPAPVAESQSPTVLEGKSGATVGAQAPATASQEGFYVVKKGDTLYRVALDHGLDYKELAAWNNIDSLGRLEIGQQLRLTPPEGAVTVKPIAAPGIVTLSPDVARPSAPAANSDVVKHAPRGGTVAYSEQALAQVKAMEGNSPVASKPEVARSADKPAATAATPVAVATAAAGDDAVDWTWPTGGKVLTQFVDGGAGKESNKGIDIAGRAGEPVQAAAAGKIVYAGSGLRGYGNLVIVRHNATYLSAYAHNSKILVKEGQAVTRGQKIAEIGSSDADQPKLHFEIRFQGKPVDPLKYLPERR